MVKNKWKVGKGQREEEKQRQRKTVEKGPKTDRGRGDTWVAR